ncbi:MAG: polyphenol oxidase family protein [Candidatus Omnitrophica bacterium]|nr:polyphenol oxidase family protein [Candidatus Omnitrophota bacterium]
MKKAKHSEVKKDPKRSCYTFRAFRKYKAIAGFSTRRYRVNFTPESRNSITIAHRKAFCDSIGVPFDHVVCLEQVHGANIVRLGAGEGGKGTRSNADVIKGTDAALTDEPGITLAIRSADCVPLFFLDARHRAIGMAHIGWRGASERLASKVVQAFRRQFLSKPNDLIIGIGPTIRSCCYEVGSEFRDVFGHFIVKREAGFYFDLVGWVLEELRSEGIEAKQVRDSLFCTSCLNDEFPSYRKESTNVRHMWSILSLEESRPKRRKL